MAASTQIEVLNTATADEMALLKKGIKIKQNFPGSVTKKKYSGGLSFNKTTIATLNRHKITHEAAGKMDAEAGMESAEMDTDALSS